MYNYILSKQLAVGLTAIVAVVLASCSGVSATPQPLQAPQASAAAPAAAAAAPAAPAATSSATLATSATTAAAASETSPLATVDTTGAATAEAPATAAAAAGSAATASVATSEPPAVATSTAEATAAAATAAAPSATAPAAQAAPVCTPGALTPALTEGPYYKANPPQTSSLYQPGMAGTRLTLTGYVLNANCQPIPGARVDFWQADSSGQYDNSGYTLRGYQLTDAQGRYTVETVVPGLYPGRTEHIHVKVTPPNGQTLTTQLFFPGVAQNNSDGIFAPQNVLKLQSGSNGETATFNFVVQG